MLLLYMVLGWVTHAAPRQTGTLARDGVDNNILKYPFKEGNRKDDHKEFDPRKQNRKDNINKEVFNEDGTHKNPPEGHFYIHRHKSKWLHVKPVGRFKGDGVVYFALDTPTPFKWIKGGMIQVGGKFAPMTKGVDKKEKKTKKQRLCLQWRKVDGLGWRQGEMVGKVPSIPRHIPTSAWGVEFQTGPCPVPDEEDRNGNENYMYACGKWPIVGEVFGRRVDIEGRDMNKISQGYQMVKSFDQDNAPNYEADMCPPKDLLMKHQKKNGVEGKDVWNSISDSPEGNVETNSSGPAGGMLITYDGMYIQLVYNPYTMKYYLGWSDPEDATLWEWAILEWKDKESNFKKNIQDTKGVIRAMDPHQRIGRHRICLKWNPGASAWGSVDIQPCNRKMEKMTLGCVKHKGTDYFGLMNDANKKNIARMRAGITDGLSGKTLCQAWSEGYKEIMEKKREHKGWLWDNLTPKDVNGNPMCIHDDEKWENEDGDGCRTLVEQSKGDNFDMDAKCQTQKTVNGVVSYAYEKCNCLACEPLQCVGAWGPKACTNNKGWGNNQKMFQWGKTAEPWKGKHCDLHDGDIFYETTMDCPYIVDCIGEWVNTDECGDDGKLIKFYKVTEFSAYNEEPCDFPPGTRQSSDDACPQ